MAIAKVMERDGMFSPVGRWTARELFYGTQQGKYSAAPAGFVASKRRIWSVVLANFEVADKLGVASLFSIPMSAVLGCAGGGFLGFLSQSRRASA